jgi:hydroxymethylpyrimidine/phosphomethylpyrimidine kinase
VACALAIGGLDPGGGAGLCADLRAIAAAGAFGCAAIAVTTIQSTAGLVRARPLPSGEVLAQAREVLDHQRVRAIKVGALGTALNVAAVAALLASVSKIPAVVDTPMQPSRGHGRLLETRALAAVRTKLVPRAALVTVNVPEAEALLGQRVLGTADARAAAAALVGMGARGAIVKGGHLGGDEAIDVLAVGGRVVLLRAPRLRVGPLHGAGCTFASLIAGRLASGGDASDEGMVDAARWAKRAHHAALARAADAGGPLRVIAFGQA